MSHYTYMVTNKINGKVYVGSHSWSGEGLDPNYYGSGKIIKRAVEKYGKENFQVEVLYYYDTVEECRKDEERILTEYNVKDCPHSYNIKNAAIGWTSEDMIGKTFSDKHRKNLSRANTGKTLSDEHRKKISQALKGKTSDKHRKKLSQYEKKTPVVAIQIDTGKVKIFEGQMECARQLNLDNKNIYYCLKNRQKSTGGYIIKYLKRCSKDYKIPKRKAKKTEKTKATIKRKRKGKTPVVAIQIDTGKIRAFESIIECSRVLGANPGQIYNCLKGRQKTCKGYLIKYIEQLESGIYEGITDLTLEPSKRTPTPIVAIHKATGKTRMFKSQYECSRVLGVHQGNVNSCLKGRYKSTGGYTFKYINRDRRVFTVIPRSKADINRLRGIAE